MAKREKPPYRTFDEWHAQLPKKEQETLKPYRDKLLRLYGKQSTTDIGWWHAMGVCLDRLLPGCRNRDGASFIELIADKLEPGRNRETKRLTVMLYRCRSFATKYGAAEVRDLKAKIAAGQITTDHVTYLLSVNKSNSKTRDSLLSDAVENRWSANQLRRAIQDDRQALSKCGGRRPEPRTTTNPAIAARDIIVQARRWSACHTEYFGRRGLLTKPPQVG